jgi:dTMP kinase
MFFSFDGVDGTGKSTQIRLLADALRQHGHDVITCRDPGSTPLGERLREILLERQEMAIHRRAEMLLYMTARAQLVEEVIRPALSAGKTILSDRYLLANVVYQGHAGGLDPEEIWRVGQIATSGIMPKLVFVLDMPADRAAARIQRSPDRIEAQGLEYLEKVRQGFLTEARLNPHNSIVINADQLAEEIHKIVLDQVVTALKSKI